MSIGDGVPVPNQKGIPKAGSARPPGLPTWILVVTLGAFMMWTLIWLVWNGLLAGLGDDGCPLPQGYGVPIDEEWQWFPPGMRCSYDVNGIDNLVDVPPSLTGTAVVVVLGVVAVGVLLLDHRKATAARHGLVAASVARPHRLECRSAAGGHRRYCRCLV